MESVQEISGNDVEYTPREHREKWHDQSNAMQQIQASIDGGFKGVKERQDVANGRVKELELSRARQEGFNKAMSIFGAAAWTICFAFTVWVATQIIEAKNEITAINAKLSAYDITVVK